MFALRTTCRLPSASTLSTSQLRQYKDRSVPLRFEKFNRSGNFVPSIYRPARCQPVGRLSQPRSSNGVSQKRPIIQPNLDNPLSLQISSHIGKVPKDYLSLINL